MTSSSSIRHLRWKWPAPACCIRRSSIHHQPAFNSGGHFEQWLPRGDAVVQAAVARAVSESFPHVRVFHSLDDRGSTSWRVTGLLLPITPFNSQSACQLRRLPTLWSGVRSTLPRVSSAAFSAAKSPDQIISGAPQVRALQDDRPENEYFILRRERLPEGWLSWMKIPHRSMHG